MSTPKKVYCNCTYAKIIDAEVKSAVLERIAESGEDIICLPDICEMAARKDPELEKVFAGQVKLAACYERSVKWLCHKDGIEISTDKVEVINMRELSADEVCEKFARLKVISILFPSKYELLSLGQNFVQDNFDFVREKNNFVRAEGWGI